MSSSVPPTTSATATDLPLCRLCGSDLETSGEITLEICTSCIVNSHNGPTRVSIPSPNYGFSRHGPQKDPYPNPG